MSDGMTNQQKYAQFAICRRMQHRALAAEATPPGPGQNAARTDADAGREKAIGILARRLMAEAAELGYVVDGIMLGELWWRPREKTYAEVLAMIEGHPSGLTV